MSIKIITGGSGAGKSYYLNKSIVEEAVANPDRNYIVVVPEQYTMQTQKALVMAHPQQGLINIDIVSFKRLAFRVFDELGTNVLEILDDTGKNLILRKVIEENKENLTVYKNKTRMQGFIEKIKSSVSELYQYNIDIKDIDALIECVDGKPLLKGKLQDVKIIYDAFNEYIKEKYITKEELLKVLAGVVHKSKLIKNSKLYFDGFTGFTPIQLDLLGELNKYAEELTFTAIIDGVAMKEFTAFGFVKIKDQDLFKMTKDTMNSLCEIASANNEKVEIIKKFDDTNPYRIKDTTMLKFMWENLFRYDGQKVCKDDTGEIGIYACKDTKEEAVNAASIIAKEVLSGKGRYRDFAIVTGAQDEYRAVMEEAMKEYDIPYFIDSKSSIIKNPFAGSIRAVLEIIIEDFSYDSVMRYLRTGMSFVTEEECDIFENYILAAGVKGYRKYTSKWKYKEKIYGEEKLTVINHIRSKLVEKLEPLKVISVKKTAEGKGATVEDISRGLYDFIVSENMEEKLNKFCEYFEDINDIGSLREYSQVYKSVMDLFDRFVILLGDEIVDFREYSRILDAGLEEIKLSIIPPTMDQVVIGDITRTRLSNVKHIFLVGVNDGIIPAASSNGGVFSENDREFLQNEGMVMSPTVKEDGFIQKFYLYMLLTKPEKKLTLSYAGSSEDGKLVRPSYLIDTVTDMFPAVKVRKFRESDAIVTVESGLWYVSASMRDKKIRAVEEEFFVKLMKYYLGDSEAKEKIDSMIKGGTYRNVADSIGKSVAKALYGEELMGSITRLENYAKCAYAHFLRYGLKLKERELYKISLMDIGNMYHSVIQGFFEEIELKGYEFSQIDKELRESIIEKQVLRVCEGLEEKGIYSTARNQYIESMVQRVSKKISGILIEHIRRGSYEPSYYELSFGGGNKLTDIRYDLDDDVKLRLRGVIDRVDLCKTEDREYVKIIDYKSGNQDFSLRDVYEGINLQIIVYLDEFIKREKKNGIDSHPAAALYFHIDDPVIDLKNKQAIDDEKLDEAVLKTYAMKGIVNNAEEVIKLLDKNGETDGYSVIGVKNKKSAYGKEAESSSNTIATSEMSMNTLMKYAELKIIEMGNEIIAGNCDIIPVKTGKGSPCEYCEFAEVCSFDKKSGNNEKLYEKLEDEEIWEKINNKVEESNT